MRISKKMLKMTKKGLAGRLRELCEMYDSDLEKEWRRCFPENGMPMTPEETRTILVLDCLDLSIPDFWFD